MISELDALRYARLLIYRYAIYNAIYVTGPKVPYISKHLSTSHEDIPTPLRLLVLMIQSTSCPSPRLARLPLPHFAHLALLPRRPTRRIHFCVCSLPLPTAVIPTRHSDATLDTARAECQTAVFTRDSTVPRRQHDPAVITRTRTVPGFRTPHAQSVARHGLRTRPLELHSQVAQEGGVPPVIMALEEAVRLLEAEEVEHELPQGRRVADLLVQNPCIAGRQDAVGPVREIAYAIYDGVAGTLEPEAVRERIHVQEGVVGRSPIFEGRGDGRCVEPGDEELEM